MPAGGPYELRICGKDTVIFNNVMIGEVWICSGQSNMEMPLAGWGKIFNYEQEIAAAHVPDIRLFHVPHRTGDVPLTEIKSDGWKPCSPVTIPEFSAVAYFFARYLQKELNVSIGLIQSTWGGSAIENWTSSATLIDNPDFNDIVLGMSADEFTLEGFWKLHEEKLNLWGVDIQQEIKSLGCYDHGWEKGDYSAEDWKVLTLPTIWENDGLDLDGIVWFRKEIQIPGSWQGQDLTLSLGPIDDVDVTWFNGYKIGSKASRYINRKYSIPASVVKTGKNILVVQVLDVGNKGGISGKPGQLNLVNNNQDSISLAGIWQYNIDSIQPDLKKLPPGPPARANRPMVLFNGMIAPLIPYGIRGAIWYQGENNASRAYRYRSLFPALIKDWRAHWNQGDFPFFFVQLANYQNVRIKPADSDWAELREAQLLTLSEPNTGMAVCIDIGEADDIHPKNKQEVGRRLALNALNLVYDQDVVYSGPLYRKMRVEGNKIRLSFDHIDDGLTAKDGDKLTGFSIAGSNKKFVWADAEIDGETILVSSPAVPVPVAVRYAWASNPVCNLYNGAGLPASPFRTDSWNGVTKGCK